MFKLIAFAMLSIGILYISRGSLRAPRSHGFYRFFAWELIAALLLLNVDVWFLAPGPGTNSSPGSCSSFA